MSAFNTDDCVDNRLPFWSGKMLKQLKTLLNTPGKTYDDLMADPNWRRPPETAGGKAT